MDVSCGDPVRVLLVEDHPGFRFVLRALLEADDRLILIGDVGSSREALEHPFLDDADVALVDIGLPGTDGLETMRGLRERNPALRVLIMSGSGATGTAERALAAGADAYVEKGGLHHDLIETIVDAGGRARAARR